MLNKWWTMKLSLNVKHICAGFIAASMIVGVIPISSIYALNETVQVRDNQQDNLDNQEIISNNVEMVGLKEITPEIRSDMPELTYEYGVKIILPENVMGVPADYMMKDDIITSFTPEKAGEYELKVMPQGQESFYIVFKIEKKKLTVADTKVKNKIYDGTTAAEYIKEPMLKGTVEDVQFCYEKPRFITKNVGKNILVQHATFQLGKEYEDRYSIVQPEQGKANIEKKKIFVSNIQIENKVYDHSIKAQYKEVPSIEIEKNDDVKLNIPNPTFMDGNVGTGKKIFFDGEFTISGEDTNNYQFEEPDLSEVRADIDPAELIFRAKNQTKTYGEENPDCSYEVEGIVDGDQEQNVIIEEPDVSCTLDRFVSTGIHEGVIKINGGKVNQNYKISYKNGDMEVLPSEAKKGINYQINQPNGENDYFVGTIPFTITPKKSETSNYDKIASSPDGPWLDFLSYTEDIKNGMASFYLKDSSNGAISKVGNEIYSIDTTRPEVDNIEFKMKHDNGFSRFLNQLTFKKFFNSTIEVTISASDKTSGVHSITYTLDNESNQQTKTVKGNKITFDLSSNFKGHIYATAKDNAGNISERMKSSGVIIENGEQHIKKSKVDIDLNSKTQKKKFYNTDVLLDLSVENDYSGIYNVEYQLGDKKEEERVAQSGKEIKTKWEKTGAVLSKNINQNDTQVQLKYEDNAGNCSVKTKYYNLDISAPRIYVSYQNNDSKNGYYNEKRTAKIVIEERNFSNEDTIIKVTRNGKVRKIKSNFVAEGGLLTREDGSQYYKYVMNVQFVEDGDYTFTISSTDKAGNINQSVEYEGENPRKFTIDKMIPQMTVTFDNYDVKNKKYYKKERTATIRIFEHNFDTSGVEIDTSGEKGKWYNHGDIHILKIKYKEDGEYDLFVKVTDKAGNVSRIFKEPTFIIDCTKPIIKILSPEKNNSSNVGNVAPEILIKDKNVDQWKTSIDGYHNGKDSIKNEFSRSKEGVNITYDSIAKIKGNDDFYTLTARAEDKAGNIVTEKVHFTVNRFGSVYTLDNNTKKINGTYVVKPDSDIIINEYNPDKLVEKRIRVSKNSQPLSLEKGMEKIKENVKGWHQYTYAIRPEAFSQEGSYQIFISSKDAAGNRMSSNQKGKKAELKFGIDKTRPLIDVLNVKDGAVYYQKSKDVKVHITDNLVLKDVKIYKNGETYNAKLKDDEYIIPFDQMEKEQSMEIIANDAAGNLEKVSYHFYVMKNEIKKERKKLFIYAGIAIAIASLAAVIIIIFLTKREKKLEEDE